MAAIRFECGCTTGGFFGNDTSNCVYGHKRNDVKHNWDIRATIDDSGKIPGSIYSRDVDAWRQREMQARRDAIEQAHAHFMRIRNNIVMAVDQNGYAIDMSRYQEWLKSQEPKPIEPSELKSKIGGRYGFVKKQMKEK